MYDPAFDDAWKRYGTWYFWRYASPAGAGALALPRMLKPMRPDRPQRSMDPTLWEPFAPAFAIKSAAQLAITDRWLGELKELDRSRLGDPQTCVVV